MGKSHHTLSLGEKLMGNNEAIFEEAYKTFQPKILRYLARLVGEHEAEDLTQSVFFKVNQGLMNFRGESSLSTWIYRIATNAAKDSLRTSSLPTSTDENLSQVIPEKGEDDTNTIPDSSPTVEQHLIRGEMAACIRDIVNRLPESYRTVIVLSELEGFNNRDIAEILDVTLDIVKIRLHRARARLKQELENHCNFYLDERSEFACTRKECSHSE